MKCSNPLNLPLCPYCDRPLYNQYMMEGEFCCGHCNRLVKVDQIDGKLAVSKL